MALPYQPYVTTYDVVVDLDVTPDTRTFNSSVYNRKHVKVIGRRNVIDQRRGLCFFDCASVTIIGGHFEPPVNGFPINSGGGVAPGTLSFQGCGSVYLEGVWVDNKNLIVTDANIASMGANGGDAIYFSGGNSRSLFLNGNFTAQNCGFVNVRGVQTTPNGSVRAHGDIFQTGSNTQGKAGHVRFYNCTGSGDYQGFFLDPQAAAAATSSTTYYPGGNAGVTINRVNLKRSRDPAASYRLSFLISSAGNYDARGYPVNFTDFYVQGWGTETLEQTIWPNHEAGSNNFPTKYRASYGTDAKGRYATYNGLRDAGKAVLGNIYQGAPPAGDFVTSAQVGRNYTQGTDLVSGTVDPVPEPEPPPPVTTLPPGANNLIIPANWVAGGTGTTTRNATTGALTVTPANDTTRTYYRQQVGVQIGRTYQITWELQTTNVMWRMLGTTAGSDNIVAVNVSTATENKLTFTATTTSVWFEFNRVSSGATTVGLIRFEEVPPGAASSRRLNGRNQYFRLAAGTAGLLTANANHYVGGWIKWQYLPTSGAYIADFATSDATTSGGQNRARIVYDPSVPKILASTGGATLYSENFINITAPVPDTWHYVGMAIAANRTVRIIYDTTIGGTTSGTGTPEAANLFQTLQLGARVGTTVSSYSPILLADWIWCSGFVPTDAQILALANKNRPSNISGFDPTYYWPLEGTLITEDSVNDAATLTASNVPGTNVGPDYIVPTPTEILPLLMF